MPDFIVPPALPDPPAVMRTYRLATTPDYVMRIIPTSTPEATIITPPSVAKPVTPSTEIPIKFIPTPVEFSHRRYWYSDYNSLKLNTNIRLYLSEWAVKILQVNSLYQGRIMNKGC